METLDAIRSRRNVRVYEDRPIDDADLQQILDAGRRTPSSRNEQRWDFVVVSDRDRLEGLSHIWQGARHIPDSAVTVALVGPDPDEPRVRESVAYDMGQLTMSMMLAAADLGIGSGHSSAHNVEVGRDVLDLPEGLRVWWLIGFGYPADRPLRPIERPARRSLDDLVHHETW
jgi:nitroreductase